MIGAVAVSASLIAAGYTSDWPSMFALDTMKGCLSLFNMNSREISRQAWATKKLVTGKVHEYEDDLRDVGAYRKVTEVDLYGPTWAKVDNILLGDVAAWTSECEASGSKADRVDLLFVHGGYFVAGSAATYVSLLSPWTRSLHAKVFVPELPQAPDVALPIIRQTFVSSYRAALRKSTPSNRLVVAAEGSGCCLAISGILQAHASGYDLPSGIICMSPLLDVPGELEEKKDLLFHSKSIENFMKLVGTPEELKSLSVSSIDDSALAKLPPVLIVYDDGDLTSEQAKAFQSRLQRLGVPVDIIRRTNLWPAYMLLYHEFPEGLDDMKRVREFVDRVTDRKSPQSILPPRERYKITTWLPWARE